MRELKFRAWDTVFNTFIDLNGLAVDAQTGELCCSWTDSLYVDEKPRQAESFIVSQFMGREDKNGVEIYEGDILHVDRFDELNGEWRGVIKWQLGGLHLFHVRRCDPEVDPPAILAWRRPVTVIGNIYQSPELL